jgi:predicted ATPase
LTTLIDQAFKETKTQFVMRIKSLSIHNVKSYPNAELEFSQGINLLIGENNSGKTTIIRSLLNLQYHALERRDIRSQELSARTIIELSDVSENDLFLFENPRTHEPVKHHKSIEVFWQLGITPDGEIRQENLYDGAGKTQWRGNSRSAGKTRKGTEITKSYTEFSLFPDVENMANFIFPFLAKRKTDFYDTNINHEQYFKIQEGMRNLAARVHRLENPSHPRHDDFISLCDDILGFRIGVIPVDQQHGNGYEPGMYVTNTSMIPIRSMGEGVVNILGFIVTLLTEDNKLILVEELENDIHPTALKKLLVLINEKSQNNQFVISTHSHIVLKYLGAVRDSKIFYTETINNFRQNPIPTTRIIPVENDPKSRMNVLEKLGYDFNDFELFEAYLILEESSAECIIRDFLIPNFVPKLYGRLRTIAAKGVDDLDARFSDFHRLFVYVHTSPIYYKKAWVIADGDDVGLQCIASLKGKFKSWPTDHFLNFSTNNFEEFYPSKFKKEVVSAFALTGTKKQKAKERLVSEVMKWALENRTEAIKEFESSAAEVITQLQNINKKLSR